MIKAIFFDLGGVLVELNGEAEMRRFVGDMPREELWRRWLHSPAVRAHETGRLHAAEFADSVVREYGIDATPDAFLASFERWIVGPYGGAHELIDALAGRYQTGLLTNTSAFHWAQIEATSLPQKFDHVVASFQVGRIKPDRDYFEHALEIAGVAPPEVLFFDDNEINCEGARACGIQAHRVLGAAHARAVLTQLNLLD
jgi:putative hydrolase of the HAD superfamily